LDDTPTTCLRLCNDGAHARGSGTSIAVYEIRRKGDLRLRRI
jgi:hypothetical protein